MWKMLALETLGYKSFYDEVEWWSLLEYDSENNNIHELRSVEILKISNSKLLEGQVVILEVFSQQFEISDGFWNHFLFITLASNVLVIFWFLT